MPKFPVDLHMHTTASDGHWTPSELIDRAEDLGINVIAVTDHDTVSGIKPALQAASGRSLTVISGVELSVTCRGQSVHLLGYFFDPDDGDLRDYLEEMDHIRTERAKSIVEKLRKLGIDITFDDVEARANGASLGRPHVADVLLEKGIVDTSQQAFNDYLKDDGPAFVAKPDRPAARAIELLHQAGGVSVLAHPGHWTRLSTIQEMVDSGLDGIEVSHPAHDAGLTRYYRRKAESFGLIPSGGSDAHGREEEHTAPGMFGLTNEEYERLRSAQ